MAKYRVLSNDGNFQITSDVNSFIMNNPKFGLFAPVFDNIEEAESFINELKNYTEEETEENMSYQCAYDYACFIVD